MTREFFILAGIMTIVLVWMVTMVVVHSPDDHVFGHTRPQVISRYAARKGIPSSHVLIYQHNGHRKRVFRNYFLQGHLTFGERPVVGDHIHMAMSLWVHGRPRNVADHDRDPIEHIPYETGKDTDICKTPGNVSYSKVWPHAGVHTHCDGLIHVHPWSAPRTLRQEGLDARLGLWFDQVGIRYRERPVSLEFSDGTIFVSNRTHRWHIAEKRCFLDQKIHRVYTEQLDAIWLGYAYASYVAWYGPIGSTSPGDIPSRIVHLRTVGAHSAFEESYPQTCI